MQSNKKEIRTGDAPPYRTAQTLEIVGFDGNRQGPQEVERKLKQRAAMSKTVDMNREGVLGLFARTAGATDKAASMLRG